MTKVHVRKELRAGIVTAICGVSFHSGKHLHVVVNADAATCKTCRKISKQEPLFSKPISINEALGRLTHAARYCAYCGERREPGELNHEARIHHGARDTRCIDRRRCERARRRKA